MLKVVETEQAYKEFVETQDFCAVYYSSHKCGVCNTMKPQVEELLEKFSTPIVEVVVNEFRELASQQLIMTSPTVVFYDRGRELFRESGFIDLSKIERNLKMIYE